MPERLGVEVARVQREPHISPLSDSADEESPNETRAERGEWRSWSLAHSGHPITLSRFDVENAQLARRVGETKRPKSPQRAGGGEPAWRGESGWLETE